MISYCIAVLALGRSSHAAVWSLRGHDNLGTTGEFALQHERHEGNSSVAEDPNALKVDVDIKKDARKTYNKASHMRPHKMVEEDVRLVASYLLPGRRPDFSKKGLEMLLALLSVLWFIPFKKFCYVSDQAQELKIRNEKNSSSKLEDGLSSVEEKAVEDIEQEIDACDRCWRARVGESTEEVEAPEPDLVIVCYNPTCPKYTDSATTPAKGSLKRSLGNETLEKYNNDQQHNTEELSEDLPRLAGYLNIHSRSLVGKLGHAVKGMIGVDMQRKSTTKSSADNEPEDKMTPATSEQLATKNFGSIRAALIQDLYELLPTKGFSVTIFNSVDKDELFLCVSLQNEQSMKKSLAMSGLKLQIQRGVVEALNVKQNPEEIESSPPYIKYDPQLASFILGEDKTDTDFFRPFVAPSRAKVVMHSTERFRCILKLINSKLNLDQAKKAGFIVGWYPAHTRDGIVRLDKRWSRWALLGDLTFEQPLTLLQRYFGSRFAFLFAWNGCYCKLLLALVPVAIAFELANAIAIVYGQNPYWNRRSLFGFALVVAVWTRFAANTWMKQEAYLVSEWGLKDVLKDANIRPEFFGESEKIPSVYDDNIKETYYPKWKSQARQAVTWIVTSIFCCLDFFVVMMWIDLWHGRLNIVASIILAIVIQIFTQIFNIVVEVLTNFENHKYQLTYYNSYLMKMFFFQFVNQYSAFFYIAVKQQFTKEGCPRIDVYDNDCVGLLNEQLPRTLLVLTLARVVQVVVATLMVKFHLWYEDYQMKRNGEEVLPRSFLEEQAKFGAFRVREQIEASVQLLLALGFVLIFGTVSPRIALLTLIVFMVQLRAGAVLVTTAAARAVPRKAAGVGPLKRAVEVLTYIGVMFTGYLIVCFGPLFEGCLVLTRVSGFMLWIGSVALLWTLVDALTVNNDSVDKLEARREHVTQKITELHAKKLYEVATGESSARQSKTLRTSIRSIEGEAEYAEQVRDAAWEKIPSLWELHQKKKIDGDGSKS